MFKNDKKSNVHLYIVIAILSIGGYNKGKGILEFICENMPKW